MSAAQAEAATEVQEDVQPAQELVLRMVAGWEKPLAILAALEDAELSDDVSENWIRRASSERGRPEWTKPIIAQYREEFLGSLETIPCRHRGYRLARIQAVIDNPKTSTADCLKALMMSHEQSGDKVDQVAEVGGPCLRSILEDLAGGDE